MPSNILLKHSTALSCLPALYSGAKTGSDRHPTGPCRQYCKYAWSLGKTKLLHSQLLEFWFYNFTLLLAFTPAQGRELNSPTVTASMPISCPFHSARGDTPAGLLRSIQSVWSSLYLHLLPFFFFLVGCWLFCFF